MKTSKSATIQYCLINVLRDKVNTLFGANDGENGKEIIKNGIDNKYLKYMKLDAKQKYINFKANKKLRTLIEKKGETFLEDYLFNFLSKEIFIPNGINCTVTDLDIIMDIQYFKDKNLIIVEY